MTSITQSVAWKNLAAYFKQHSDMDMRQLFAKDAKRFEKFQLEAAGLFLDYSKNRIDDETISLLLKLTDETKLKEKIQAMFAGENLNCSEEKPVLHVAMRNRASTPIKVKNQDIMPQINEVFARMKTFCEQVRSGEYKGITGKRITDIINISIGGSNLGPQMLSYALAPCSKDKLRAHFVANVDGSDIATKLAQVDPETTLIIVGSKSFTTIETMTNAETAKQWLTEKLGGKAVQQHFIAATINPKKALEFGIRADNIFEFWTWVGGRFSGWSSIGLVVALVHGMEIFERVLDGAYAMDQHFKTAPFEKNMPVILSLLGIWYHNFFNAEAYSVVCYDEYMQYLPRYLQQVDMESNGKCVFNNGKKVDLSTSPIIFGDVGTNSQHSFHQLFHQGTHLIPVDFFMPLSSWHPIGKHHELLFANCLGQAEALLNGKTEQQAYEELIKAGISEEQARHVAPHKAMPGNRPSNMFLMDKVTPEILGAIMSLYELKIFVQGIIWGINSFDQFGVELGKELANNILPNLAGGTKNQHDASTEGLIARYRAQ